MTVDRIEAIIHDWTCGCGKGQACPQREDCHEAAEQIVAIGLKDVLRFLRGSDSDDHEYEMWRRTIANDIEREFSCPQTGPEGTA